MTGGAGYIGSHAVRQLRSDGSDVVVFDNLSNGFAWSVGDADLVVADLSDHKRLVEVFQQYNIKTVLHFAASIDVNESTKDPLKYYLNNTSNTATLLTVCKRFNVERFVFSSTAAVYGLPGYSPVAEDAPLVPISPYGDSKAMSERIIIALSEVCNLRYVIFRYFNVGGADSTGNLGECRIDPTHLIPSIFEVALGNRPKLTIYGDDYSTSDGTCIRDYIHVEDLARAHVEALAYLQAGGDSEIFNCGYGRGISVREVVDVVRKVTGANIPVEMGPRREGDPDELVATSDRVRQILGWRPRYDDLETIIRTSWNWKLRWNKMQQSET